MKHSTFLFRLAGIAAISAVLLMLTACGAKNDGTTGAGGKGTAAAASTAAASATPAASATAVPASPAATTAAKQWAQAPAMQIDAAKSYSAQVKTSKGTFTIELFAKDAPLAVNNFVFLAKEKFYDGVVFHRIIETFMIQTGDPKGNGTGGPGYKFDHEPTSYSYDAGIVAMANSGPNTNGSQFFIVTGDASHLNKQPNYTVFGKVTEGMDTVVTAIAKTPVKANPSTGEPSVPTEKVTIESIEIVEK
ncbi:MAG: peptidylprolyl isomerase [Paenibacillaceae bacterium]|jgi:cyclophilin family peptidyl-prolyl cis-trans isomerase|nr:peptidylprolyl isomerase [Paenibacillaceae bacterium]